MNDPIDIFARTIWGEARGEGNMGMVAVACVIMNRVKHGGWWGNDVLSVCQKPFQFSCWNENDPNREKLIAVDGTDTQFVEATAIAVRVSAGDYTDLTNGADSYYDRRMATPPIWAANLVPTASIGHHIFYQTV
ncbi:MAG: cell wall hydrolase [Alphaproteobacteria bacterium]|nr:cell wall hydrolase [Alphaproteobacteria bacterium]